MAWVPPHPPEWYLNLDNLNFKVTRAELVGMPPEQKDWLRKQCQTNLRFLANCIMRPKKKTFLSLSEKVHGRIIDNFLKPDPDKSFDQWDPEIKEWVTLASRGILKSTLVASFLTQCILCDPDIRILIVSGKLSLAASILNTARKPFATNEVILDLFPEWCVEPDDLVGDAFLSPKRDPTLDLRDPTLSIGTFDAIKAGGHFEIVLFDDCTNEINCANNEQIAKCEDNFDDTDPLVEPGGYRPFFGTTWGPPDSDLPQVIRRRGEAFYEEHGERNTRYFELPAFVLREGTTEQEHAEILDRDRRNKLRPEDVIFTWPEKLNSRFLWPKYRAKPNKFNMQYRLRYTGGMLGTSYTHEMMLEATRPYHEGMPLPHDRFCIIRWDLADVYSGRRKKAASDFSCGIAGMFELSTRRLFCYDAVLDVFSSSTDMATAIVEFFERQLENSPVGICAIEDAHGARLLQGEIASIAKEMNSKIDILWQQVETVSDQKNTAIAQLAGVMKRGLVQFAHNIPERDEIYSQFEKWSPKNKKVKDDAPDNVAQIWKNFAHQIHPGLVTSLMPNDVIWAPEPMVEPEKEPVDPHAEERENADFGWLQGYSH